jgi:hypothetical protein
MKREDIIALSLGLGLPILVLAVVVTLTYFIRQYYINYRGGLYNRVKHSLDDEEIEFKNAIEMQSQMSIGEYEELDVMEDFDGDDFEENNFGFGDKDRERLSMIDKYRSNLVAGASAAYSTLPSDVPDADNDDEMHSSSESNI